MKRYSLYQTVLLKKEIITALHRLFQYEKGSVSTGLFAFIGMLRFEKNVVVLFTFYCFCDILKPLDKLELKWDNTMVDIRAMTISDYDGVYDLWINTPGMGLNSTDDSKEGIEKYLRRNHQGIAKRLVDCVMSALDKEGISKVALVVFKNNDIGNVFWEHIEFIERDDLVYRNKNIHVLNRIDT